MIQRQGTITLQVKTEVLITLFQGSTLKMIRHLLHYV